MDEAGATELVRVIPNGCQRDLKTARLLRPVHATAMRVLNPSQDGWKRRDGERARACKPKVVRSLGKEAGKANSERRSRTPRVATPDLRPLKRRQRTLQTYQMNFDTLAVPLKLLGSSTCQS